MKIPHSPQIANCLITGLRSALLFLSAFAVWYATAWNYGFLIFIVPVVFSVTLGKVPHPEVVAFRVFVGTLAAIPPGLLVFAFLTEAPSAFEMLVLLGGPFLFFGLMGLTNLPKTFAYCLGFCISFVVFILPLNTVFLDTVFAIERSMAIAGGALILSFLFVFLPRRRLLSASDPVTSLYAKGLQQTMARGSFGQTVDRDIGLMIDRMMQVVQQEAPERAMDVIAKGSVAIFIMSQLRVIDTLLRENGEMLMPRPDLSGWKTEILQNYLRGEAKCDHPLGGHFDATDNAAPIDPDTSRVLRRLTIMDQSVRRALAA